MSQYPGSQPPPPPQDPYYGQPPADPYGAPPSPPAPGDPYFGAPPPDPYAPPQDPYYGQQPPDPYAQQQAWYAPPPVTQAPPPRQDVHRGRGGSGAAIFGILLVLIGAWILFGDQIDIDLDFGGLWPIAAVVLGGIMVVASVVPRRRDEGR
jgi:hypothetical protein